MKHKKFTKKPVTNVFVGEFFRQTTSGGQIKCR